MPGRDCSTIDSVNDMSFQTRRGKRALRVFPAILSAISLTCACGAAASADGQAFLRTGIAAPAFQVTLLDGKTVRLRDLRGKVVALDFWATWCGPCRPTMKTLQALQEKYGGRLAVVGVSLDDETTADQIRPTLQRLGVTYRIAASYDQTQAVKSAYRVPGAGLLYVIDRHGIIRWSHAGTGDDDALVKQRIEAALDKPAGR